MKEIKRKRKIYKDSADNFETNNPNVSQKQK